MATHPIHQINKVIPNLSAQAPSKTVSLQAFRTATKSAATMKAEVEFFMSEGQLEIAALWKKAEDLYMEAADLATSGADAYCKLWEAKAANEAAYQAFLNFKV